MKLKGRGLEAHLGYEFFCVNMNVTSKEYFLLKD